MLGDSELRLSPFELVTVNISTPGDGAQNLVAVEVTHAIYGEGDRGLLDAVVGLLQVDNQGVVVDHKVIEQFANGIFGLDRR